MSYSLWKTDAAFVFGKYGVTFCLSKLMKESTLDFIKPT